MSTNECRAPGTPIFSLFRVTCSKTPPGLFPSWIYLKSLKFHEGISQKQNQKQNSHYVPHKHRRPPKNSSKVQCEVASLRTKPKTLIEISFLSRHKLSSYPLQRMKPSLLHIVLPFFLFVLVSFSSGTPLIVVSLEMLCH